MKSPAILFLTHSHFHPDDGELQLFHSLYPHLEVTTLKGTTYTSEQLAKAEIIVGFPKPEDLVHATSLRWLHAPSSGVTQYADKALFARKDVLLTNSSGTYGKQIADHIIGMIIAFNHNFFTYHNQMKERVWKNIFPSHDIWESTLLIVGLGDIGTNLAKRAKAHGMRVLAVKRTPSEKPSCVDALKTIDELDSLLGQADYLALCPAYTKETEHLIDARRLSMMKSTAYLINVGRGALVDEQALIEALETKRLAGAGLDVTQLEPLPPTSKLWSLENVFITPHSSGLSPSDPHQVFSLFLNNLRKFLHGEPMQNLVDFQRKY
ncbi:MAG: D-2-hydroxyacid dehydrogenase [Sphaerochaeta sp.]|nr:D-2-hydroxyacid dehydrogenase [Sphaerochaeta sp.]